MRNSWIVLFLLIFFGVNSFSQTTTVTQDADFVSTGNSMWGSGSALVIEDEFSIFHLPWNQNFNTGSSLITTILGQSFGAGFQGSISGQIGSEIRYSFNSGSVDVDYPIDVNITYPDDQTYDQGDWVTVETAYTVDDVNATLTTEYPGGEVMWDIYFQLAASASATVCFFGCTTFPVIPAFDTGLITINIATISSNGATTGPGGTQGPSGIWFLGPGAMPPYWGGMNGDDNGDPGGPLDFSSSPYPGTEPTVNNSLFPYSIPLADAADIAGNVFEDWIPWQIYMPLSLSIPDNDMGISGDLELPGVDTDSNYDSADGSLDACGESEYFSVELEYFDLLGFILTQAPPGTPAYNAGLVLQNLAGTFDPLDEVGYGGLAFVSWNFFSASYVMKITNNQCFDFDEPTVYGRFDFPFPVEYQVFNNGSWGAMSTGSIINLEINDDFRYKFPCYYEEISFNPQYTMSGQLSSHTWDEVSFSLDLSALGFGIQISSFTIIPGFTIPSVCFPLPYPCPSWSCPWCWCTTTVCTPEIVVPPVAFPGVAVWVSSSGLNGGFGSSIPDPLPTLWSTSLPLGSFTYDWFNDSWTLGTNSFNTVIGGTITMRPYILGITNTSIDLLCSGDNTGELTVTTDADSPATPFNYSLWSETGTTTASVLTDSYTYSNLIEGSYQVSVVDANGCQMYTGAVIQEPLPVEGIALISDKNCFGTSNDGSITVTASGGVSGYDISWNGTSTGDPAGTEIASSGGTYTISGLSEGNYDVIITDDNSCQRTYSYTIDVPDALGQVGIVTDVNCFGENTGAIDVTTFGGVQPYTFSWSSSQTTEDITGIGSTSYTLLVTDSKNCTSTSTYAIAQPAAALQLAISGTDVNCFGGTDGSVDLTVTGGTPGYSFEWSNGQGVILPMSTEDLTNVQASIYTVNVEDNKGCGASISQAVSQPNAPLTSSPVITNINCFGGSTGAINPTIAGGTSPYSFNWSNGATTSTIAGVAAGVYTLIVIDSRGCTSTYTYAVSQPSAPLAITLTGVDILCNSGSNGSVTSIVTGGTTSYNYSWNTGATSPNINGLIAGNYVLNVTDSKGCTASASVTLTQPALPLIASSIGTDVSCHNGNNGAIDVTVNGGTAPYTYLWNNSQSQILTATTQDLSGLNANTYSLSITDNNGCQTSLSQPIAQPAAPLAITGLVDEVNCFGITDGAIDITVTGGTPGYSYSWSNGASSQDLTSIGAGTYSVQVTDLNGCILNASFVVSQPNAALAVALTPKPVECNGGMTGAVSSFVEGGTAPYTFAWSNSATSEDIEFVSSGIYTLTVTDAQGCTAFSGANVTEPVNPLTVNITVTDPSCFGYEDGSIVLDITGGTQPYYFNWGNENEILLNNPSETLNDIPDGDYLFRIRDANGCIIEQIVTVTEPTLLEVSHIVTNTLCYNDSTGMIDLTISGATPPYSTVWSDGQTTEDAVTIPAGFYTYTVTDAQGCQYTDNAIVTQPNELEITYTITGVSCIDQADGSISVVGYGGTPAYNYQWDNSATTPTIGDLAPGTYVLVLSDNNMCYQTFDFVIESNPDECVGIPNTFSPNGDDYNDTWFLENIDLYPNASVKIFNKWGNLLYNTEGIYTPWDGTDNGNPLPSEVYYYIITLGNPENNQYTGTITIVR